MTRTSSRSASPASAPAGGFLARLRTAVVGAATATATSYRELVETLAADKDPGLTEAATTDLLRSSGRTLADLETDVELTRTAAALPTHEAALEAASAAARAASTAHAKAVEAQRAAAVEHARLVEEAAGAFARASSDRDAADAARTAAIDASRKLQSRLDPEGYATAEAARREAKAASGLATTARARRPQLLTDIENQRASLRRMSTNDPHRSRAHASLSMLEDELRQVDQTIKNSESLTPAGAS